MNRVELRSGWCVYSHSHNGVVFYIGKGISQRPYASVSRGKRWKDFVSKTGHFDVVIIEWFDDEQMALKKECDLILELKPSCNHADGVKMGSVVVSMAVHLADEIKRCSALIGVTAQQFVREAVEARVSKIEGLPE